MTYEYTPKIDRQRAIRKSGIYALLMLGLYFTSLLDSIPLPSVFQIGALVAATGLIISAAGSKGWMRHYCYRIEPGGDGSEIPDFTVTETFGKRISVVCRASLSDIPEILESTKENRKKCHAEKHFFSYTPDLPESERRILKVCTGEVTFWVEIAANQELLNGLKYH